MRGAKNGAQRVSFDRDFTSFIARIALATTFILGFGGSTPAATLVPSSTPTPTSTPAPAGGTSVRVSSIAALKTALADDTVDEIVVANGTYHVSSANQVEADSLWIASAQNGDLDFAGRTRPITVRAETTGGVTFDGGGGSGYMGMAFEDGAHDQTWDGFNFANMAGTVIEFGGYTPSRPPHHITLRNITLKSTCRRTSAGANQDQGIYFSDAAGRGPNNLLLEDITVDGSDPLSVWSAIHAYHGDATNPPPDHVTIRRLTVTGTTNAIILWDDTAVQHDWLIDGATITNARANAVRFESIGANNIVFKNIVSTGSGSGGFYSTLGANPPGVSLIDDSLR